jgi:hypothetical protein
MAGDNEMVYMTVKAKVALWWKKYSRKTHRDSTLT